MEKLSNEPIMPNLKLLKEENQFNLSDSKADVLFEEISFANLKIKNHFLFQNLTDDHLFDHYGNPTEKMIEFYQNLIKTDVGLIFTGGVYVGNRVGNAIKNKPKFANTTGVKNIMSKLTESVHTGGSKIFLTIKSLPGRASDNQKLWGIFPYSASYGKSYLKSKIPCVRLNDRKCDKLIDEICDVVKCSNLSGFDGILIDASLFDFVGEISSFEFNKRKFGYYSETYDFLQKLTKRILASNKNQPIIVKFGLSAMFNWAYGKNAKNIKTIENFNKNPSKNEIFELIIKLINIGVDGFIFEIGTFETEFLSVFNQFQIEEIYKDLINEIRGFLKRCNSTNKFGSFPTIIVKDNFNSLSKMNDSVKNDITDFVDITKQIYADNNYLINQKTQNLSKLCVKCSICDNLARNFNCIDCTVNPGIFNDNLLKSDFYKNNRVAVVGAGIAGINASIILAERGFDVELFEESKFINQNSRKCEVFSFDELLNNYNDFLEEKLLSYQKQGKLKLHLNTKFDKNFNYQGFYSIIIATGFHEKFLTVSGAVLKNVKSIYDVLASQKIIENANSFVLDAKSELSLKLALFLLSKNKKVSIVIHSPEFLLKLPNDRLTFYLFMLKKYHAKVYLFSRIKQIQEDFAEIVVNSKLKPDNFQIDILNFKSGNTFGFDARVKNLDLDLFVYEPDIYPNNKLFYELVNAGFKGQLYLIGNALQTQEMFDDIKSAYFVAKNL